MPVSRFVANVLIQIKSSTFYYFSNCVFGKKIYTIDYVVV